MGRIETLAALYRKHIEVPWQRTLAGAQRVLMVVYDKELERVFRARKGEFAQTTKDAGFGWVEFDATRVFAEWMAAEEYRDSYFEAPEDLTMKVEAEFAHVVADRLRTVLRGNDEQTVVAFTGTASLYGFARVSDVVRLAERDIRGRLVVFFPGTHEAGNYRLLDARDGWTYLAPCISLHGSGAA